MIAGSVADEQGVALTAGLISAAAVLCLMVATAVGGRTQDAEAASRKAASRKAESIEARVAGLVAAGCDEGELRALVAEAVELGGRRSRR